MDAYSKSATAERKRRGVIIIDNKYVADTLQCVHCYGHWVAQKGSGIKRGFCTGCVGPTCGQENCDICIPSVRKLEMMEKNMTFKELRKMIDHEPKLIHLV